ncbi:hypothetical protein Cni_G02289 [Canna indica]|uniref:ARM repeat superfamily protein n=1 Tax=Canna indica TaxID=4628 RepID=A0AAQ3JNY6_9LILI|nr:hypothetical protein Cni_G02289 [Canna indica]
MEQKQENAASVFVQLPVRVSNLADSRPSFFAPYSDSSTPTPRVRRAAVADAPEKKLTLFAFRLALLEKSASGLGTLAFVWATVVLLGGFAITLEPKDFVFVTIILVTESTRIFSRSHELSWQHQSTGTLAAAGGRYSIRALQSSSRFFVRAVKAAAHPFSVFEREPGSSRRRATTEAASTPTANNGLGGAENTRQQRTWNTPDVPLLPYVGWVFVAKNIGRALSWLQVASAIACIALSLIRLIQRDFGEVLHESRNRNKALHLFYALALAEAIIYLMEKAYWEWKISYCNLLQTVSEDYRLGTSGIVAIRRFFYDTYSKCINGTAFDGLKMDLVTFAQELLNSDFRDEQLIGVQILQKIAINQPFAYDTLRKIGTSTSVIERLIDMLNWRNPDEEEIRRCAAEIVSKLAGKKQNALRVAGIPGALESISSLLHSGRKSDLTPHELNERSYTYNTNYDYSTFNLLGLRILKKLATDHNNCGKIGNARGLLPKIIDLTSASRTLLRNDQASVSQIETVKRSLQVVKMLVSTTGNTGKALRQEISEIVFTVSNIREILQYGESHLVLQTHGIEILKSLAMDEDAKETIGRTGGIIKLLLSTFLKPGVVEDDKLNLLRNEAGETLAMLALDCKKNCDRIFKETAVLYPLTEALRDPVVQINASRILRNLCAHSRNSCSEQLKGITAALPTVLKAVMETKEKLLEVSIGLTTQMCKLLDDPKHNEFAQVLKQASIKEIDLVKKLVEILKEYTYPEIKVPRIRRFVIEQAIWMMESNRENIENFKMLEMEKLLGSVAETTLELECFHIFSGSVGLSRHSRTLSSVVDIALHLISKAE